MSDDLLPQIVTNASGPASVKNATEAATQHPLPDQIAADRYAKANQVTGIGMRMFKLVPPGAANVNSR